jgi:hypothetical protein
MEMHKKEKSNFIPTLLLPDFSLQRNPGFDISCVSFRTWKGKPSLSEQMKKTLTYVSGMVGEA